MDRLNSFIQKNGNSLPQYFMNDPRILSCLLPSNVFNAVIAKLMLGDINPVVSRCLGANMENVLIEVLVSVW